MKTLIYNKKFETEKRKNLRSNLNLAERLLWARLKERQLEGYKFRRQYGFGPYVVDFYCPELKIAVEIDGVTHFLSKGTKIYDEKRQKYIENYGVKFIRISNQQVLKSPDDALELIRQEIKGLEDH